MKLRKITAVLAAAALLTMAKATACSGGAANSASETALPLHLVESASSESTSSESASSEGDGGDMIGEITVLSREDGLDTRRIHELFGIEQKNDAGEK